MIRWRGEFMTAKRACEVAGVHRRTYEERRKRGWTPQQALETKPREPPRKHVSNLWRLVRELEERVAKLEALVAGASSDARRMGESR